MKMRPIRTVALGVSALAVALLPLALSFAQSPAAQKALAAQKAGSKPQSKPAAAPSTAAPAGGEIPAPVAQAKANQNFGHLLFQTHVGSFKVQGSDDVPVQGALDMNFTGTVLVSAPAPGTKVFTYGKVRKEYETADKVKQVYFGTGRIVVVGKLRAVQFFGRELTGRFDGVGIFRFYGEFDKNLETGTYWFEGMPDQKTPWGTSGINLPVPNQAVGAGPKPRVKIGG